MFSCSFAATRCASCKAFCHSTLLRIIGLDTIPIKGETLQSKIPFQLQVSSLKSPINSDLKSFLEFPLIQSENLCLKFRILGILFLKIPPCVTSQPLSHLTSRHISIRPQHKHKHTPQSRIHTFSSLKTCFTFFHSSTRGEANSCLCRLGLRHPTRRPTRKLHGRQQSEKIRAPTRHLRNQV